MPTVFVARELERPVLVTSSCGTDHQIIPFKDDSALVAWIGNEQVSALLDNLPTAEMLLGTNHGRAIGIFAKMLRDVLGDADEVLRLSSGLCFSKTEFVVATREGTWRIDHAFQVHACAYVCIGDGVRLAESLFGEYVNMHKDITVRSLIVHALHVVRNYDDRVKGTYRFPKVELTAPDPFMLPLQPKLAFRD